MKTEQSAHAGSRLTTQNDQQIGATTNSHNTSIDTGNMSLCVKEFTPSMDIKQLKRTMRDTDSNL